MNVFLVILGLIALGLLATSKRAYRFRRNRFVAAIVSGGWLSLLVGVALGPNVSNMIPRESVYQSIPLVAIALGWIGFMVGFQIRFSLLFKFPAAVYRILVADLVATSILFSMLGYFGLRLWIQDAQQAELFLPVVFIVAASLGWKLESRSVGVGANPDLSMLIRITGALGGAMAIIAFGFASKFVGRDAGAILEFNPDRAFLKTLHTLLLAGALGILARYILRLAGSNPGHQLTAFLGIVAFAAGSAKQIDASPLITAMLTGVVVANIKGSGLRQFETFIFKAEHILAVVFGILAGVLLEPALAVPAVVLAAVLSAVRVVGKPPLFRAVALLDNPHLPEDRKFPDKSPLYLAAARQSPLMLVLGVSLVIVEPSIFHKQMLALMVVVGIITECAPLFFHPPAALSEEESA